MIEAPCFLITIQGPQLHLDRLGKLVLISIEIAEVVRGIGCGSTLANLTFNFQLWKQDAPLEYKPLGEALSPHRQEAAESGEPHTTARKLGGLFVLILPEVPNLYKAYGTRASEIGKSQQVDPKRVKSYGPFADHAGVDGTTIWAAATSGEGAIAVHLLACVLARQWSPAEATAIWEELVLERKKELKEAELKSVIHIDAIMASKIEVSTQELARWDAGARAWLESADKAKRGNQNQLMLVIDNLQKPVETALTTYKTIMAAWRTVMETMDKIISGVGHVVQSGIVLLGLSSWHLYPDMTILSYATKQIHFSDPLIRQGGNVTVGVEAGSPSGPSGVFWSLPLSCLRFYGDTQNTRRSLSIDTSRLDFDHFMYIALGCASVSWTPKNTDPETIANMFVDLGKYFQQEYSSTEDSWPATFSRTAQRFLRSSGNEREYAIKLLKLGKRNPKYLGSPSGFSLFDSDLGATYESGQKTNRFNMQKISSVLKGINQKIDLFRFTIQTKYKAHAEDFLIRIKQSKNFAYCFGSGGGMAFPEHLYREIEYLRLKEIDARQGHELLNFYGPDMRRTSAGYIIPLDDLKPFHRFSWIDPPRLTGEPGSSLAEFEWHTKGERMPDRPTSAVYSFLYGDEEVAVFSCKPWQTEKPENFFDLASVRKAFTSGLVDPLKLLTRIDSHLHSLLAMSAAAEVFENMAEATVSLEGLSNTVLGKATWYGDAARRQLEAGQKQMSHHEKVGSLLRTPALSLSESFGCICMFVSGTFDLDPAELSRVMAVSAGDSLYVAGLLLNDPSIVPSKAVERVPGNIGRHGMALLIPPTNPKVLGKDSRKFQFVNHDDFDGRQEDSFQGTSLLLSFTDYSLPFEIGTHGDKFVQAYKLETVVSAFDQGNWVADLDVIGSLANDDTGLLWRSTAKSHCGLTTIPIDATVTSVDHWQELIEAPDNYCVVRAKGNWLARLAIASVSFQLHHCTVVLPQSEYCWHSVIDELKDWQEKKTRNHVEAGIPQGATLTADRVIYIQ